MLTLMTCDPVLVDANFTCSGSFSLVSVSSLFPFVLYFWIFKPCNTMECLSLQTLHILLWHNLLHWVLWKYCQGIHSMTSYIVSCFYLWWFDSKILDFFQYHDGHHKLDTALFLFPLFPVSFMTWVRNLCFVDLLDCFNGFSSCWSTASLEKRGLLTRAISSSMKFVKSVNLGSLIWTFLIFKHFCLIYLASTLVFLLRLFSDLCSI